MLIYGINPVLEALRAGRVVAVSASDRATGRTAEVVRAAERAGLLVRRVAPGELDRVARGGVHQGIVAELRAHGDVTINDLLASATGPPLLVVLDGVEDPHNVGAVIRSVDAAGAHGIVRQLRHAAPLSGVAGKASAGAVAYVKVADVVNISRALEELKQAGVWTVGLATESETRYDQVDLTVPTAVVVGAEGSGLRRLVREHCDWLVSIPMRGHVQSLNVSVAAGVILFEAVRQRQNALAAANERTETRPNHL